MAATLPALTRPPEIFSTHGGTIKGATRTPCHEKEWYGGEQRPETPGRDRGGVWPCSCSPHPPWPSTMRRSGVTCSVGAVCGRQRHAATEPGWATPRGSASRCAGRSATCPPQAGSRLGAWGSGRHVCPLRRCLDVVVSLPGDRPPGVGTVEPWWPLIAFPGPPPRGGADDPGAAARGRASHDGNLILVTHQVNITALTGIAPAAVRWSF